MELDLIRLRDTLQVKADQYDGGADTYAMFLEGQVETLNNLIKLGFKVAK